MLQTAKPKPRNKTYNRKKKRWKTPKVEQEM